MAKGANRSKLAPVITLAPGCTITPKSGTMLDFSKNIEWTLKTPDGSTVKYYLASVFVMGDTDEANMVPIKIRCNNTGAVDPNIVSFSLPGIIVANCFEHLPELWRYPGWSTHLGMAKGTDCTKLAPIITLSPGARITEIYYSIGEQDFFKQVDYTGIVEVGVYDFTKQFSFTLIAADGSRVYYSYGAHDRSIW